MFSFFKKNNKNPLLVYEIEESDKLTRNFGISDSRCQELSAIIEREMEKSKSSKLQVVALLSAVSKECKHANELSFVSFAIGHALGQQVNSLSRLISLLGS